MSETSFPRQYARTQRFSLGVPRDFSISPDGGTVLFARSGSGSDPVACLWRLDVASGEETLLLDPRDLLGSAGEDLPPEERARRERARESSQGVVRYRTDDAQQMAVLALSGRLFVLDLNGAGSGATARELPAAGAVLDPRPDPTGRSIAYVSGGGLRVCGVDGSDDRALAVPESPTVTYGLAEHIGAEEIGRFDGYWWSPDGSALLVARVDTAPVASIWTGDPAHPDHAPVESRFPFAGTPNAEVTLSVVPVDGSAAGHVDVASDQAHEYLVRACWPDRGPVIAVQSRDQRSLQVLDVDPATGSCSLRHEERDDRWVEIVDGVPAFTAAGDLVWATDAGGSRRLVVGGAMVTPADLRLRSVLDVDGDTILFTASSEPTEVELWAWSPGTGAEVVAGASAGAGVRSGHRRGGTTVVVERTLDRDGATVTVRGAAGGEPTVLASYEEVPVLTPRLRLLRAGGREVRTALLLPAHHQPGNPLPVLLDPYGGPGAQRVLAQRSIFLASQWFAEQGFAVVVADGRGTPGRGSAWEREIAGDLAGPVLEDQVDALHAAARECPDLDLDRVAVRGWSFGGFLAALAVLRRPDVFHAAVAGAPVTDWHLYDTHYTERYLGTPDQHPDAYARSGLLEEAATLSRPLMIIHGLADDNVLVAHSLQLSARLTAAGRPHTVLPLSGVTHATTPHEQVAENLLLLQLDFLRTALGIPPPPPAGA